jgi:hypothetical protein
MHTLLEEIEPQITEQLFTLTFTPVVLLLMQRACVRLEECGREAGSNSQNYVAP